MTMNLNNLTLTPIRQRNPKLFGYNVEMAEVTGGTFWKPYTPEQVAGTEPFPELDPKADLMAMVANMMSFFAPADLYDPRLRTLAKELGPAIVRFSGSWATKLYFDPDGHTGGKAPEGFAAVLTREQWQGALDFAKAIDAEIMVSVANCPGTHRDGIGEWFPDQAAALWDYTEAQGMKIAYAEFMNEPNILVGAGMSAEYGPKEFGRDHDLFARWLQKNHPETKLVGPCNAKGPRLTGQSAQMMIPCDVLLDHIQIQPASFSYHSYTGISERGKLFGFHYEFEQALDESYLEATMEDLAYNAALRDQYAPGADLWVTESADAGSGGNTWAPTFVEVIRLLDELCKFAQRADGVILHNTLAASAYGLLEAETNIPRPQYWAALLYNKLMGLTVYETGESIREGCHLFAQSRGDGKEGKCWLYLNNSWDKVAEVEVPDCEVYQLTAPMPRSTEIYLNGEPIVLPENPEELPALNGVVQTAGTIVMPPCSATFIVTA